MVPRRPRSHAAPLLIGIAALALAAGPAAADPPIWESNFGKALTDLNGKDDFSQTVTLSFSFPFAGSTYDTFSVSTNGGIAFGMDLPVDYDAWNVEEFATDFLSYGGPVLYPFETDLDQTKMGTVYFNDFGDRAVFTWDQVGSFQNPLAPFTFQVQVHTTGEIVFGYNGLPEDLIADLGPGIVVGLTSGDGPKDPGAVDYSADAPFRAGTTIYEVWCCNSPGLCHVLDGQRNSAFDLDQMNVAFTPVGGAGFDVTKLPEPDAPALMGAALGTLALLVRRRPRERRA